MSRPFTAFEEERLIRHLQAGTLTYNGKRGLIPKNRIAMPAAWKATVADGKVKLWQVYCDWTEGMRIIEEDKQSG